MRSSEDFNLQSNNRHTRAVTAVNGPQATTPPDSMAAKEGQKYMQATEPPGQITAARAVGGERETPRDSHLRFTNARVDSTTSRS